MRADGERCRLERLYQEGAAKVRFPSPTGRACEAVLINTAGGVTGGDRFDWSITVSDGAACTAITQACEKIYRAEAGMAEVDVRLQVGAGARLDWLPQETILFDGARLTRRFEIDLAADARLLAVECAVLGRRAMGEVGARVRLNDRWRVRRGGRLILADNLTLADPTAAGPALLDGAGALAVLIYAAPDAEARLGPVRAALGDAHGGASAFDGKLLCRILAADGMALRGALLPVIAALRDDPLPRLWTV